MSDGNKDDPGREARQEQDNGMTAMSLLLSGLLFWGGIGWLVSRWLDNALYMVLGILLGVGAALYLVWIRYGRA